MPLVDTVISFGVAKASRFGLLQHPITLTSQMATSATDRKAAGVDIAVWSKLLRRCSAMCHPGSSWNAEERRPPAAFQQPRQIFFSLAVVRASSAMNGSVNGGRDASLETAAGFAAFGGDAAS
jgi:hypothetical protein